jgi:hypothetical protein
MLYSLYMTKSYINSRTINHYVIYSYTKCGFKIKDRDKKIIVMIK